MGDWIDRQNDGIVTYVKRVGVPLTFVKKVIPMRRWLLWLGPMILALLVTVSARGQGRVAVVARATGAIDPSIERYVVAALRTAETEGAQLFVLELDTPGGLDTSMRAIVQAITRSPLPVVVYVGPQGARAASAGVFIAYAADVAAMAPSTSIGAAHPVSLGDQPSSVEEQKMLSDAEAYIRALAEARGRNADWAAQAVRQSVSATANEALSLKVADLLAGDLPDLLQQLNGRTIQKHGRSIVLDTSGMIIREVNMSLPEQIVHVLVNPSVTYLLLAVAVWALIAEFSAPGISVPGVIGLICLVLFGVSASIIPINWAGAVLILASIVFFIADVQTPTQGVFTVGGIATFVFGSLLLFRPLRSYPPITMPQPQAWQVPVWLMVVVIGVTAGIFGLAVRLGVLAQRAKPIIGDKALVGAVGRVTSVHGHLATVQVRGELWSARPLEGEPPLQEGDSVEVVSLDGLTLNVRKSAKKE